MVPSFNKNTTDILDYTIDWTSWLGDDELISSSWVAGTGITKGSDYKTPHSTTVILSGGTADTVYNVTNTIVTQAGRTKAQCLTINVKLPCEN